MSKNSFGQSVAIFLVIIGILYVIGTIGEAGEPKCIKAGCNNNRQVAATIVIFMNRLAVDTLHTEVLPMIASLPTVLLRVIRKVRIVVIATTQRRTVLEKAPMIRMMTDMTISTWTAITIMTDMTATVIMRMGWMMRWTRLGRIGKDAF